MTSHQLLKAATTLAIGGLIVAISSFASWGEEKRWFALLFFYFPILWLLWISCVFSRQILEAPTKLVALWILVDLTVLTLFVSFSTGVENWGKSQGIEMVTGTVYLPLGTAMLYLVSTLPDGLRGEIVAVTKLMEDSFGTGIWSAFGLWLSMSILSFIPSVILAGGSWYFHREFQQSKTD